MWISRVNPSDQTIGFPSDLLQVVAEGDLDAILLPQHLAGHQGVENGSAGQRQAEVHAEQPPVLCRLIKLRKQKTMFCC